MLRGIPSLSKNLWYLAYLVAVIALLHFVRVAVDGVYDHKWFDAAIGVWWAIFAVWMMVGRYPEGLRKFPIVEPAPPARRPSRRG